ncbi:hypothetical protein CEXT_299201 [Caerostris extrusa]|uniref:Uncharacterized protein n=1 Tax=Caerostris extrusa TaxID=172846 RepID=A0AAV4SZ62_CAEEX|nr:hypothetical protein CEXT_299201 [Caerostris extrusa]
MPVPRLPSWPRTPPAPSSASRCTSPSRFRSSRTARGRRCTGWTSARSPSGTTSCWRRSTSGSLQRHHEAGAVRGSHGPEPGSHTCAVRGQPEEAEIEEQGGHGQVARPHHADATGRAPPVPADGVSGRAAGPAQRNTGDGLFNNVYLNFGETMDALALVNSAINFIIYVR